MSKIFKKINILLFSLFVFSTFLAIPTDIQAVGFSATGFSMKGMQVGFDPSYRSILNTATALGYTLPSASQQNRQNTFIITLKSMGIWNSLDVLYVFATDGNHQFAQLNWKDPSLYQITEVATPTFTTNSGFDFNASTQYLNTNWIPSTNGVNYTRDEAGIGAYVNENTAANGVSDFGASGNSDGVTAGILLQARNASDVTNARINQTINQLSVSSVTNAIGFHHLKRTTSSLASLWKNGVAVDTQVSATSTALVSVPVFIGAANGAGTATRFSNRKVSMFFAGASLTGKEANLYTAWNNYFSNL